MMYFIHLHFIFTIIFLSKHRFKAGTKFIFEKAKISEKFIFIFWLSLREKLMEEGREGGSSVQISFKHGIFFKVFKILFKC